MILTRRDSMTNYAIGSMDKERWIRKLKCLGLSKVPSHYFCEVNLAHMRQYEYLLSLLNKSYNGTLIKLSDTLNCLVI